MRTSLRGGSEALGIRRPGTSLCARQSECETLDGLLDGARAGHSGALVLRGEPGVGKTALLEYAIESASGMRVARAFGVEAEMELAFAGLHQLCGPMLGRLQHLPGPQRDALGTVFGRSAGSAPDRFLIGLAVLSLLSDAAEDQPLLCVVDDAQWLDGSSAQALGFVARRLFAESVAFVFATREPSAELRGLPELLVEGLRHEAAHELLASVIPGPLDPQVRERIVAETRGNPLALLEMPRGLTPGELAGGFGLPDAPVLAGRIEESFSRRFRALPAGMQLLLLVAAAEPLGDPVLVWRAAERLGIQVPSAADVDTAGLLEFGVRVRFRHPLARSAVYRAAGPDDRRRAHGALAEATDPGLDPDRRAWHRAQAAYGFDEDVAEELERSADRAQTRGGFAAAAAFLEQAVRLTPQPARRAARGLAAARAKLRAGDPDAALILLAAAEAGSLDALQRDQVDLQRAQIAFAVNRGNDVPPLLLKVARRLEERDARLARETYLDALSAAGFVGRLATGVGLAQVAEAARLAPPSAQPARAADLLMDGLAVVVTEGYPAGTPILKRALSAFRGDTVSREEEIRWGWIACHVATELWDDESLRVLATRYVGLAREAGALTVLPIALPWLVGVHLNVGEFAAAALLLEEMNAIAEATGSQSVPYVALSLAAFQGHEAEVLQLVEVTVEEVVPRGEGVGLTHTEWARAFLYNGLGRYDDALTAALQAREEPEAFGASTWVLPELIEAAVRAGKPEHAADAVARLSQMTRASGTDWALGVDARSRALLSEGAEADRLYREAIERFDGTAVRGELARAHLIYGEWLRRRRRRLDARRHLRTAHEMLTAMGMEAFAERAGRELQATGGTARKRTVAASGQLTAQEGQIARLATDGLSNAEIGARLFISPRTVEYHLSKIFAKLGIGSRTRLQGALAGQVDFSEPT